MDYADSVPELVETFHSTFKEVLEANLLVEKNKKRTKRKFKKKKRIKESLREINFDLEPRIGNFI